MPSSYQTSALDQAVEKLWAAGVVIVTTSGNLGPNSVYYAPGNDPFVITVGASDSNDTLDTADDFVASFSSYGVTADGFVKPEIVATGRHIVSNVPDGSVARLLRARREPHRARLHHGERHLLRRPAGRRRRRAPAAAATRV